MDNDELQKQMDRFRVAIYLMLHSAVDAEAFTEVEAEALDLAILSIARQMFLNENPEEARQDELDHGVEHMIRAVNLHNREQLQGHIQERFESGPHLN